MCRYPGFRETHREISLLFWRRRNKKIPEESCLGSDIVENLRCQECRSEYDSESLGQERGVGMRGGVGYSQLVWRRNKRISKRVSIRI